MADDRRNKTAPPRAAARREDFLSKLFTSASTVVFLAISGAAVVIALGYTPLFHR
jgi:hypothetical protein